MSETFHKSGKIIEVSSGKLDVGVKTIVKQHAIKKEEFKKAMSDKFKKYIGIHKKTYKLTMIISTVILTVEAWIYGKNNKKKTTKTD